MLLLMAAATLAGTPGAAPDATFVGIQATRILSSAARGDEICRHDESAPFGVAAGDPIAVGALHAGTRSGAATKNAKAEAETAATTTTTTRHVRVRRPGDSTKVNLVVIIGGKPARPPRSSAPDRVPVRVVPVAPAVDTIKDAAKTIDLRPSVTNAKKIIAFKGGSAPGDDPSRETRRPSAPPPSHASHQVLLHYDTVANKIVGRDPTLLSSDRANNNNNTAKADCFPNEVSAAAKLAALPYGNSVWAPRTVYSISHGSYRPTLPLTVKVRKTE